MIKRTLAIGAAMLMAAGTALAFHCPSDMKKIDEALAKKPKLTEAEAKEVTKLRADGEAQHKAGKHDDSMKSLGEAKKILGI